MNTNIIPLTFSPSTEAHEALIEQHFPRAAGTIFRFLSRLGKPGTSIQFDKDDFNQFCDRTGRKRYCTYWFKKCFNDLVSTRLVQIERVFRGCGYQVRLYHPWQIDDWVVDEFGSDRQKQNYNKTCENDKKTCGKSTSDPHDSVADYRESREKKSNTKASDRPKPKPTPKKTASAAASTSNEVKTAKTASFTKEKGCDHVNQRSPEPTGVKNDLNVKSENVSKTDRKDKKVPPVVEVKINNKEWRSHLEEIDQLGVRGNKTIVNALKTYSKEKVEAAIALYRARKRETGYIENPCGYFIQALKEDWAGQKAKQVINNDDPQNQAALFRCWFELAKEFGLCSKSEEREGERWVYVSGTWEKFTDAWERGFNLEYLRKTKKRHTKP